MLSVCQLVTSQPIYSAECLPAIEINAVYKYLCPYLKHILISTSLELWKYHASILHYHIDHTHTSVGTLKVSKSPSRIPQVLWSAGIGALLLAYCPQTHFAINSIQLQRLCSVVLQLSSYIFCPKISLLTIKFSDLDPTFIWLLEIDSEIN